MKLRKYKELPIQTDLNGKTGLRLTSRKPLWIKAEEFDSNVSPDDQWKQKLDTLQVTNSHLM